MEKLKKHRSLSRGSVEEAVSALEAVLATKQSGRQVKSFWALLQENYDVFHLAEKNVYEHMLEDPAVTEAEIVADQKEFKRLSKVYQMLRVTVEETLSAATESSVNSSNTQHL